MENIIIKSDCLTVGINPMGAELKSVKDNNGNEFIWGCDPKVWAGCAPILFPICGGLKDDKYVLGGKEYVLQKHGFARTSEFAVKEKSENAVTFSLCDTEDTLKVFPFEFELEVYFEAVGNSVKCEYRVINKSDKTMYFGVGAHEGYACPEGIEEYDVIFPKAVDLDAYQLNGNLLQKETVEIAKNCTVFPLKEEYFEIDALVFKNLGVHSVELKHRNSGRKITVEFPGHEYFLMWQKHGAKYICIEPWRGFPDYEDSDYDFVNKDGIISLEKGQTDVSTHTMTFEI